MRDRRLRGSAFHGVVSTGASTPESFGFSNPETTPLSIPTNPATAPANNPFYTKRFTFHIGRRCRNSSIRDVAKEHLLDWKTVKALEMEYMREQIKRAGHPRPKVLGVDEISIRKGHTYR